MALTLVKISEGATLVDANGTGGYVLAVTNGMAMIHWSDGVTSREPVTRLINSTCGYKIIKGF